MWPTDGAFLFSANPASIRGLCEEWSRRGFSPESFSPRPSRRLRVQFPPEFSVSYRRRPILSVSSKTRFCDVMRCFRHLNRVFRNQRGSESWDRFWHPPQKSHSSRAEFHFAVSKTPFTRPILCFSLKYWCFGRCHLIFYCTAHAEGRVLSDHLKLEIHCFKQKEMFLTLRKKVAKRICQDKTENGDI